jgi:hypothetical protein
VLALSLKQKQPHTSLVPVSDGNQPLAHTSAKTLGKSLNASPNSVCWLLTLWIFKGENPVVNRVRSSPLLEVEVGARVAKEYSLPHFEAPKSFSSATLYLGAKSTLLEA